MKNTVGATPTSRMVINKVVFFAQLSWLEHGIHTSRMVINKVVFFASSQAPPAWEFHNYFFLTTQFVAMGRYDDYRY